MKRRWLGPITKCLACPAVIEFDKAYLVRIQGRGSHYELSKGGAPVGHAMEKDGSITYCPECWARLA